MIDTSIRAYIQGKGFSVSRPYSSEDFTEAFEWCKEYLGKYKGEHAEIFDGHGLVWDNRNGMNLKNR
jgi:hypothetical protein